MPSPRVDSPGYRAGYEAAICKCADDLEMAIGSAAASDMDWGQLVAEVCALVRVREAARAVVEMWRGTYTLAGMVDAIDALAALDRAHAAARRPCLTCRVCGAWVPFLPLGEWTKYPDGTFTCREHSVNRTETTKP